MTDTRVQAVVEMIEITSDTGFVEQTRGIVECDLPAFHLGVPIHAIKAAHQFVDRFGSLDMLGADHVSCMVNHRNEWGEQFFIDLRFGIGRVASCRETNADNFAESVLEQRMPVVIPDLLDAVIECFDPVLIWFAFLGLWHSSFECVVNVLLKIASFQRLANRLD